MSGNIVGLDIGTSYVRAIIGEYSESGTPQITGIGKYVSTGLRNGLVVNIESTTQAIKEAVEAAEMLSGFVVTSCVAAIGGTQVAGHNSRGTVAISSGEKGTREISKPDIGRAIEVAKAVNFPLDRQILHIVPQGYAVDGQDGIKDPENMLGVRLDAMVHIVTAAVTSLQNVQRCIVRAGYELEQDGLMLKTLAATQAVMTDEELDLGSILIDLGGGTTDVLVLYGGAPVSTHSIALGGINVTKDIAVMKGISFKTAEEIKLSSGSCWENYIEDSGDTSGVVIPGVGGRPPETISRLELCGIIKPRVEEILTLVRQEVSRNAKGIDTLSGNIVLTGGGALLPGVVELTQQIFDTGAVRIGLPPANLGSIFDEYRNPEYATAAGLFLYANRKRQLEAERGNNYRARKITGTVLGGKIFNFFREFF
ncbi:MAG: cell division protein FtsA [Treponema sp.]|nr:cell division protein FtsA [Treponema sp.]